jgi:hypothetical protein
VWSATATIWLRPEWFQGRLGVFLGGAVLAIMGWLIVFRPDWYLAVTRLPFMTKRRMTPAGQWVGAFALIGGIIAIGVALWPLVD